ncbi:hypothetical protein JCM11491_006092 [Sporobolomyces phaffii]
MALSPLASALLSALSQLQPDENPYTFISNTLDERLLPTLPPSAFGQLCFLASLFGLAGILILISQAVRWKKGIIWLYRYQPEYHIIRPHATLSWSTLAVVVVILFEVLIARTIQLAKGNSKTDFGYWLLLVWGGAWVAGAVATWSLAASFIVHLHSNGSRKPPSKATSIACNIVGIASPIVYLAVLLPLGIIAGRHYAASQHTAGLIKRLLHEAADNWTPGTSFSIAELAPGLPLLDLLVEQIGDLVEGWKAVFMFYAVTAILLFIPITTISFLYLSSLRRTIKRTSTELHQASFTSNATTRSQKQIQHTWISLVLITSAFSLLATIFFVVSLYAYIRPTSLRENSTFQGLIFTPLYAFALLGFPCAVVLVFRAVEARKSDKQLERKLGRRQRARGHGEKGDGGAGDDEDDEETWGSSCWTAIWSGSGSGSGSGHQNGGNRDDTLGAGRANEGKNKGRTGGPDARRTESTMLMSLGEMLRGGIGSQGHRDGRSDGNRKREESKGGTATPGVGSSVIVSVEVEVREDHDGEEDTEEKETGSSDKESKTGERRFETI